MGKRKKQQKSEEYKRRKKALDEKKQLIKQKKEEEQRRKKEEEKKQKRNKKILGHLANFIAYGITMFMFTMFMFCGDNGWQMELTSHNVVSLIMYYLTIYIVMTIFTLLFSRGLSINLGDSFILLILAIVLLRPVVETSDIPVLQFLFIVYMWGIIFIKKDDKYIYNNSLVIMLSAGLGVITRLIVNVFFVKFLMIMLGVYFFDFVIHEFDEKRDCCKRKYDFKIDSTFICKLLAFSLKVILALLLSEMFYQNPLVAEFETLI